MEGKKRSLFWGVHIGVWTLIGLINFRKTWLNR